MVTLTTKLPPHIRILFCTEQNPYSTQEQNCPLDLSKTSNSDYPNPREQLNREPVFLCITCKINFSSQQKLISHFCPPKKCRWCNEFFIQPEAARDHYFSVHC